MKDNMQNVTVLTAFRDKDNFTKAYAVGSEIEFTKERAEHLKKLGLVVFEESKADKVVMMTVDEVIDLLASCQTIVSDVKKCNSFEELEKALIAETNGKNRKSVIEALQTRIEELQPVE